MDLAGISTAGFGQVEHAGSFLAMKKTMDTVEMQMDGVMKMMDAAMPQTSAQAFGLGQNVDMRV